MFQRTLNLSKRQGTALKSIRVRSLIYLCLFGLILSNGFSKLTASAPANETSVASGAVSAVTTTSSSRGDEWAISTGAKSLFRLGQVFVIAGAPLDDDLAFGTADWDHGQLGSVEPIYVPPPHKMMREYISGGELHLGRQTKVITRLGLLKG